MDLRKNTRLFLAGAVVLAAVLTLGFVAGCGGDQAKARQLINNAKDKGAKIAQADQKIQQKGQELSQFDALIQNITPESAAALKKYFADIVVLYSARNAAAKAAAAEYKKVLDLGDATDFKKYANYLIQAYDLIDRQTLLVKQGAEIYNTKVVDQALNSLPIDETLVKNETEQISQQISKIYDQLNEIETKAADLAGKLKID
jgi:outer membrane murein-binding lipoprotein Lpp